LIDTMSLHQLRISACTVWVLVAASALVALPPRTHAAGQDAVAGDCPAPGTAVKEPYRWYPTLDLARIPFHHSDGPWGPKAPINAPAPPVTHRSVRVTSAPQLVAEAKVPGTLITIYADYIGFAVLFGNVSDIDIVVPPGRTVSQLWVGSYNPRSTTQRVRIRGTKPGVHSGGRLGRIIFYSDPATDLIIDGVDLNGDDGEGGNLLLQLPQSAERVAVVNVRGHAVGPAQLGGGTDMVFAGNRIMSGARERQVNGYAEGWGIRAGGRIVVYDNRIDGTRYHRVRVHPGDSKRPEYAWVANNTFVDRHEARIFDAQEVTGKRSASYAGVWAICNRVYAHSSCIPPSFETRHADYAKLTSNSFFGSFTAAAQRRVQTFHGQGRDYLSGNTYAPWQPPPRWEAPGDPASVPLPPVKADRFNPAVAFNLTCPPP
jgi:hypothetical protein